MNTDTTPEWIKTGDTSKNVQKDIEAQFAQSHKRLRRQRWLMVIAGIIGTAVGVSGALIATAGDADAVSQVTINKYIRANGGIPPCTHEDGSGQPGMCYWDASERGVKGGYDFIAVPRAHQDKAIVYLTGPKAKRY